ncbi:MAG: SAM-dependent methyltransferase, partial [Niabella sp.]
FYIEQFLKENSHLIQGRVLEIHDNYYTKKFGGNQVTQSEALDIDANNKQADIIGDLRHVPQIADNTYDTIILTHTLGVIDDYPSALRECSRILKPNGIILVTVSAMGIALDVENSYWRYTIASMKYILKEFFKGSDVKAFGYGNVLSGQAFWVGLSCEDLTTEELNYNDPRYPIIIGGTAKKQ